MEQLVLWFNILSFALLFGSLGITFVLYVKYNPVWLYPYIVYLTTYVFFVIFLTYHFFSMVYLPGSYPRLDSAVLYIRFIIAVLLLFIVPKFIRSIIPDKVSYVYRALYIIIPLVFLLLFSASVFLKFRFSDRIGTVFFNGYMGGYTLYGLYKIRHVKNKSTLGVILPFLYLSCILYFAVALQAVVLIFVPRFVWNGLTDIFTAGFICFLWGSVTLAYLLGKFRNHNAGTPEDVPPEFIEHYNISVRERDIILLLLKGLSNREIGEKLFISPRTVDTHIYNIYRKCSVKNKLELVRLVSAGS